MNLTIHILCTLLYFLFCMYGGRTMAKLELEIPLECKHISCWMRYKFFTWLLPMGLLFWIGFNMYGALDKFFPL
jgi:hypothetical protein